MKTKTEIEIFGWLGAVLILLAYALSNFGILSPSNFSYQILNILGALAIVYHSLTKKDYQPAALNIVWALVALVAILRLIWTI